jgi:glycosyltransferase involved in cell wall biosynthesis
MDVTVLANTEWYCSPVKLFDYGAIGKAIISINKTGVTDVMEDNIDGLIINNNETELVDAINTLVADKVLREKLGSNFQKKVMDKHTWKSTAQRVLDTLHQRIS